MGKKKKQNKKSALSEKKEVIPHADDNRVMRTFKWKHIILIALISIAVYSNTLSMEFIWDDLTQIKENTTIKSLKNIPSMFTSDVWGGVKGHGESPYYRPVFTLSLALDYFIWGLNTLGYHLTNILLHAGVSVMFYILALKILGNELVSVSAAFVFAVHPVHAEAIAWISGRNEPLAALFMFASLYSYILYRDKSKISYLALSVFLFFIALLSKELAVTLPALILLYELCFRKDTLIQKIKLSVLYIPVILLYLAVRAISLTHANWPLSDPLLWRIYTVPTLIANYFKLLIFPSDLKVFYDVPMRQSFLGIDVILPLIFIIAIISLSIALFNYEKKLFFGMLWVFITLFPALNIIVQIRQALMADRYLYIPSAGFSLVLGIIFSTIYNWKGNETYQKIKMTVGLVVIATLFILTFQRNYIWKSQYAFIARQIADAPNYFGGYYDLGLIYERKGRIDDAIEAYQHALQLFPGYDKANMQLGKIYFKQQRLLDAEREFLKVIEIKPGYYFAHYNLGLLYFSQQKLDDAMTAFRNALRLKSDYVEALNSLGSVYISKNDFDNAERELKKALAIQPDFADARYNIGVAYMYQGKFDEAVVSFKRTVIIKPDYADAFNNLGAIYLTLGKKDDAVAQFRNALRINPENAMFKKNLDKAVHFK